MTEQNTQNFEHKELEADIQRLSKEVLEKRNLPEYKDFSNREIIKETIRPLIRPDEQRAEIENKAVIEAEKSFLPNYALTLSAEEKLEVEKLIDSIFHKRQGLFKVIAEVKSGKHGAGVTDAFHDSLTEKLIDELEKGKYL